MRSLFFISFVAVAGILVSVSACKSKVETPAQEKAVMEKVDQSGPEYTSKYICPMHCKGSGSDQPGVCPACGMDYELNPAHQHEAMDSMK